jgi:exosortase A-associated hydrolase 2
MSIETPFFFANGTYRLFGILHEPEKRSGGTGYVFCYPFAEERLWAQRVYVDFARELARRGNPVLRFDFMGNGDSEGKFEAADVMTWLSDIDSAIGTLKAKIPGLNDVGLLGLRFGATLAAFAAERNDVSRLILWDPIIDGNQYMQEILRLNLMTQTALFKEIQRDRRRLIQDMMEGKTVNSDGYEIHWKLYEGIAGIRLNERMIRHGNRCLIVQIDSRGGPIREKILDLGNKIQNSSVVNVREEPFWREIKTYNGKAENLCRTTLEWMDSCDG